MNENLTEKDFRDIMLKAFKDTIVKDIMSENPDYEWVVRLYSEIRDKIRNLLSKDSKLRKEIEEKLDVDLFSQMIKYNSFTESDLLQLVKYVFELCLKLGSPQRDTYVKLKEEELINLFGKEPFAIIVASFIVTANECIDLIYEDLENLCKL